MLAYELVLRDTSQKVSTKRTRSLDSPQRPLSHSPAHSSGAVDTTEISVRVPIAGCERRPRWDRTQRRWAKEKYREQRDLKEAIARSIADMEGNMVDGDGETKMGASPEHYGIAKDDQKDDIMTASWVDAKDFSDKMDKDPHCKENSIPAMPDLSNPVGRYNASPNQTDMIYNQSSGNQAGNSGTLPNSTHQAPHARAPPQQPVLNETEQVHERRMDELGGSMVDCDSLTLIHTVDNGPGCAKGHLYLGGADFGEWHFSEKDPNKIFVMSCVEVKKGYPKIIKGKKVVEFKMKDDRTNEDIYAEFPPEFLHDSYTIGHVGQRDHLTKSKIEKIFRLLKQGYTVIVHCRKGRHRGALLTGMFLMTYMKLLGEKMEWKDACKFITDRRSRAQPEKGRENLGNELPLPNLIQIVNEACDELATEFTMHDRPPNQAHQGRTVQPAQGPPAVKAPPTHRDHGAQNAEKAATQKQVERRTEPQSNAMGNVPIGNVPSVSIPAATGTVVADCPAGGTLVGTSGCTDLRGSSESIHIPPEMQALWKKFTQQYQEDLAQQAEKQLEEERRQAEINRKIEQKRAEFIAKEQERRAEFEKELAQTVKCDKSMSEKDWNEWRPLNPQNGKMDAQHEFVQQRARIIEGTPPPRSASPSKDAPDQDREPEQDLLPEEPAPVAPTKAPEGPPPAQATISLAEAIPTPEFAFHAQRCSARLHENYRQSLNEFMQRKLGRPIDKDDIMFDTVEVDHQKWRCQIMIMAFKDQKQDIDPPTYEGRIERSIKAAEESASRAALQMMDQLDPFGVSSVVMQKELEANMALTRLIEKGEVSLQAAYAINPNYQPPVSVFAASAPVKLCVPDQQSFQKVQCPGNLDVLNSNARAILTPCTKCGNIPECCICVPDPASPSGIAQEANLDRSQNREAPDEFYRVGPPGLMPWEALPDPKKVPQSRAAGKGMPVFKPWEYTNAMEPPNWPEAKITRMKWERDRVLGYTEIFLDKEGWWGKPGTLWERSSLPNPEARIFWRIRLFPDGTRNDGMKAQPSSSSQQQANKYTQFQWNVWNKMCAYAREKQYKNMPSQEIFNETCVEIQELYKKRATVMQALASLRTNVQILKGTRNSTQNSEWTRIGETMEGLGDALQNVRHMFDGAD